MKRKKGKKVHGPGYEAHSIHKEIVQGVHNSLGRDII